MNGFYTRFLHRRINDDGSIIATLPLRCLLLRSTGAYTFNPDHDFVADVFSNGGIEVSVASYARQTLTGKTLTLDDANNRATLDCDNIAFGALETGQTVSAAVFYEFLTNDADSPLVYHLDGKIKVVAAAPAAASLSGAITGATQANPVVITSNAHGLANGDVVYITGVLGMTQINNRSFTVAGQTTNTFQLSGENGTTHGAYTSGGTWTQVRKVYVEPLKEGVNDGTVVQIGTGDGTVTGAHAFGARVLNIRALDAAITEGESGIVQSSLGLPVNLGGGNFNVNIHADGLFFFPGTSP